MMKKRFKLILITAVLVFTMVFSVFGMAGCNIDFGDVNKPDDKPPIIENPDAEYEISVNVLSTPSSEYQTMSTWAQSYMEKNKDVNIKVDSTMGSMADLANWKLNNELPDIVWTAGDQHAPYSANNYFVDLREFTVGEDSDYFDDFYSALIDTTHYSNTDEGIWFMPRDYNQLTFLINTDLLSEAGIAVPSASWTWADLINICEQWRSYQSKVKYYPIEVDLTWNPVSVTMLANFGASVYDKSGKLTIDSAQTKECMDYLNDMVMNKKYIGATSGGFNTQTSPMMITVRPNLPLAVTGEFNIKALPYPATTTADNGTGYVGVGCSGYGITTGCSADNKAKAWDFLKYCMSEEGYEKVGSTGTIVPARESLANKGSWTEYKDFSGNVIDASAFISSQAEPISVNFCSNLKPLNQGTASRGLMLFFESVRGTGYDYNAALKKFVDSIKNL